MIDWCWTQDEKWSATVWVYIKLGWWWTSVFSTTAFYQFPKVQCTALVYYWWRIYVELLMQSCLKKNILTLLLMSSHFVVTIAEFNGFAQKFNCIRLIQYITMNEDVIWIPSTYTFEKVSCKYHEYFGVDKIFSLEIGWCWQSSGFSAC